MIRYDFSKNPDVILVFMPPFCCDTPPLGIAYLSRYLRSKGITTSVIDLNRSCYEMAPQNLRKYWQGDNGRLCPKASVHSIMLKALEQPITECVNAICQSKTKVIGFSFIYANSLLSVEMAKRIKERSPQKWIVFGGAECSWHEEDRCIPSCFFGWELADLYPPELVDAFVVGEGEETLLDIIERSKGGGDLDSTPGASSRAAGYKDFQPRPLIKKLDDIPYPTFEEFDLALYSQEKLPMIMSRGCIGRCTFCNDHKIYKIFRSRTAEHILAEMEHHIKRYGVRQFLLCDLLINGNVRELDRLCDSIINSGLELVWCGSAICRKEMTSSLMAKMRRAGCTCITYGVESFSPRVLALMNKHENLEMIRNVLKATHDAGIRTQLNIIAGFPGETEDHLQQTITGLRDNRLYIDAIGSLATCFVGLGTDLQRNASRYGIDDASGIDPGDWRTRDGSNTYKVRVERVGKVLSVVRELGLNCEIGNVLEGEMNCGLSRFMSKLKGELAKWYKWARYLQS